MEEHLCSFEKSLLDLQFKKLEICLETQHFDLIKRFIAKIFQPPAPVGYAIDRVLTALERIELRLNKGQPAELFVSIRNPNPSEDLLQFDQMTLDMRFGDQIEIGCGVKLTLQTGRKYQFMGYAQYKTSNGL